MIYISKERIEGLRTLDKPIIYRPSILQYRIHQDKSRYKLLCAGRRFGKTYCGGNECIKNALEKPGSRNIYIAPIYAQVLNVANIIYQFIPKHFIRKRIEKQRDERRELEKEMGDVKYLDFKDIQLKNMSIIKFKTGVKPERIKGEPYDFVGLNEAAYLTQELYYETILPALLDRQGKLFAESTPFGKTWYYHEWLKGQNQEENPNYKSWRYSTYDCGRISDEDLENLRKTMPDRQFRQEILAEFVDSGANVFSSRVLENTIDKELDFTNYSGTGYLIINPPAKKQYYFIGVDLGQSKDFTVLTVFNRNTKTIDAFWRFRYRSYEQVFNAVKSLAEYYKNIEICIDSTGVGKPTTERLQDIYGDLVSDVYFTYQSKKDLIDSLVMKLELGIIKLPNIPVLTQELEIFEYTMTDGGRITFNAPEGFHDDCVISLALAVRNFGSYEWS